MLQHGTYLAQRWGEEGGVNRYHCADEERGFFVEVGLDGQKQQVVMLRRFGSAVPLED